MKTRAVSRGSVVLRSFGIVPCAGALAGLLMGGCGTHNVVGQVDGGTGNTVGTGGGSGSTGSGGAGGAHSMPGPPCPPAATSEATCSGGIDDDCDGFVDCLDTDCDGQACGAGLTCSGGACRKGCATGAPT